SRFLVHRPPPSSTLFPYTTLFRSLRHRHLEVGGEAPDEPPDVRPSEKERRVGRELQTLARLPCHEAIGAVAHGRAGERRAAPLVDRKSTRLNSSHVSISYAVFCLK